MDNKRYFILTPGRSGSSLLSAVMADSGAAFAGKSAEDWDPRSGAFESHDVNDIGIKLAQAHRLRVKYRDTLLYRKLTKKLVTLLRFVARAKLKRTLQKTCYFKETANLHHMVRLTAQMGYQPVVIVNYRGFPAWLGSHYPRERYLTVEDLTSIYTSVLKNAIALVTLFGGTVVSYEDLMNLNSAKWAENLGAISGLDPQAILDSRQRRFRQPPQETLLPVWDSEVEEVQKQLRNLEGKVIPRSQAAIKHWGK